eukprot:6036303-Lingulodinium_polyedra.AAC.1
MRSSSPRYSAIRGAVIVRRLGPPVAAPADSGVMRADPPAPRRLQELSSAASASTRAAGVPSLPDSPASLGRGLPLPPAPRDFARLGLVPPA